MVGGGQALVDETQARVEGHKVVKAGEHQALAAVDARRLDDSAQQSGGQPLPLGGGSRGDAEDHLPWPVGVVHRGGLVHLVGEIALVGAQPVDQRQQHAALVLDEPEVVGVGSHPLGDRRRAGGLLGWEADGLQGSRHGSVLRLLCWCCPGRADVEDGGVGCTHSHIFTSRWACVEHSPVSPRVPPSRSETSCACGDVFFGLGTSCAPGDGIPVPDGVECPRPEGHAPGCVECPRGQSGGRQGASQGGGRQTGAEPGTSRVVRQKFCRGLEKYPARWEGWRETGRRLRRQSPRAAATTFLASSCTWARCSAPLKDSA